MSASESAGARHQLAATLQASMRVLDENATVDFTKYIRLVLPLDGSVFWVRADLASESSLYNAARYNAVSYDRQPTQVYSAPVIRASGSIHYISAANQQEADSGTLNRIVFTSEIEIEDFLDVGPATLYLGEWKGTRFSFSRRENFYEQAKLWHYVGDAVFAPFESQIIDTLADFDTSTVVSNSLPLWLDLVNPYIPILGLKGLDYPVLPSFLVTQNIQPPYIVVHIDPVSTQAISSAPILNSTLSHSQLVSERVRVTTYGLRNAAVLDFCDYVQWQFRCSEQMGITNMPVPRDDKQTQVEMGVLAQKKIIDYEVNYLQATARDIARKLITSAFVTYNIDGYSPPRTGRWNEFAWDDGTVWSGSNVGNWDEFDWNEGTEWA